MVDFTYPHLAEAGQAIEASKHNDNWNKVKNFINGDAANPANFPGLLRAVNPSATGTLTATGTVSLGASDNFYLNSTQHNVIGLGTGTDINQDTAGSFLKDLNYRAWLSGKIITHQFKMTFLKPIKMLCLFIQVGRRRCSLMKLN